MSNFCRPYFISELQHLHRKDDETDILTYFFTEIIMRFQSVETASEKIIPVLIMFTTTLEWLDNYMNASNQLGLFIMFVDAGWIAAFSPKVVTATRQLDNALGTCHQLVIADRYLC